MSDIIADYFAGGGGASTGIEAALGRSPDYAVNHCDDALRMHEANHPKTLHLREDVFAVKTRALCAGKPVALAWFSPDCRHFSKAKGAKPVNRKVRGLAWSAVRAAEQVKPRVIILENVEEFMTWGPLDKETGRPVAGRAGETFRKFKNRLRKIGYTVEHRVLCAADFGAPTTRKRFFLVARCDGNPVVWPAPTHRDPKKQADLWNMHLPAWRTAAECIDWSIPCPSIFARKRPLAESTCRRIAEGVRRYVLTTADPFVVAIDNQSSGAGACWTVAQPLTTVTTEARHALIVPTLVQTGYGERDGQSPRVPGLDKPLGTVVAGGVKHALVAAFLAKHYSGVIGHELRQPIGTVTTQDHHSIVTATLAPGTDHSEHVSAFLVKYYGTGGGQSLKEPMGTVTTRDRFGLVVIRGEQYRIVDIGLRMLTPRELASAQGFPADYKLTGTISSQVARIGNSVCPPVAEAIVRANCASKSLAERRREI